MKFLRSLTVLSLFILFGIGAGIISFMLFPLGKLFLRKEKIKDFYSNTIQKSWKFLLNLLTLTKIMKLNIEGDISKLSGEIIVASHPSLIDIVILIALIPKSTCLAKQSLMNNFLLKNILTNLYITSDVEIEEFKKNAINALDEGYNVIIFPTGKRFKKGEEIKVHKSAAMLSIATGKEIIPINIDTSYDFLQLGQPIYECGNKPVVFNVKLLDRINYGAKTESEIQLRNLISKKIKESIALP